MDINDLRAWYTLLLIFVFIGIAVWAYSRKRNFDAAANLPFSEPDSPAMPNKQEGGER